MADSICGALAVTRAFAPQLAEHEHSAVLNVLSVLSWVSLPNIGAYCAAKAGVILMTQVMAAELGPSGITVNAVCPGTVDTQLMNPGEGDLAGLIGDEWIQREIPLGRLQTADDVANAIAFLMSDDAAYITGEAVNVSGGQTMV